jgi:hypothetical protein
MCPILGAKPSATLVTAYSKPTGHLFQSPQHRLGELIAKTLARAWRSPSPTLDISHEQLTLITPLLLKSGAAALTWWRLTESEANQDLISDDLHQAYRLHALQAAQREGNLKEVFRLHRAAGIEPVLVKGWAVARHYAETGLRPYGDLDLFVPANDYEKADDVQRSVGYRYPVDHHAGSGNYLDFSELFEHSLLVSLDGVPIRVPCPEHHLRILSFHFLAHGAWRPLWLCDIALAIESRPSNFDWDRCFFGKQKYVDWIACVIGLAHQLLGADIAGTPVEARANQLPRWLVPAVLQQWEAGSGMSSAATLRIALPRATHPAKLTAALKEHWRNPIQASFELGAQFDDRPRLPLQFAAGIKRLPNLTRELTRRFRRSLRGAA